MAAVGAAAGPGYWLLILLLTSVIGAIAAIVLITVKGRFRKTYHNILLILISLGTALLRTRKIRSWTFEAVWLCACRTLS